MWDEVNTPDDLARMAKCIRNGTLIGVTDGWCDRKKGRRICGAGWAIYYRTDKKFLKGSFVKHFNSDSESSYQEKLLGMLAIHLFLLAIEEYYNVQGNNSKIYCDNKGTIFTSQ